MSKLKRLLCYESHHQSQSNEKSLVQFDYEKAVSNYLCTQSTFNPTTAACAVVSDEPSSVEPGLGVSIYIYIYINEYMYK